MTNLIFDYDGTLHNCIKIYSFAFSKALKYLTEKGFAQNKTYSDEDISKWLGYNSVDMWNEFMPSLPENEKTYCSQIIGKTMVDAVKQGKAELYEGAISTLKKLKNDGYNLIFLSNCKTEYMNEHRKQFGLDKFFNQFYSAQEFDFISKADIFEKIKTEFNDNYIIIGDRFHDIEIATKHNLTSIGCLYGYSQENELDKATYKIKNINQLYDLIKNHNL